MAGRAFGDPPGVARHVARALRSDLDSRLSAATETARLEARDGWGAIAALLFFAAAALVIAVLAASHSGGNALQGPAAITVTGEHFNLVRGRGRASAGSYSLETLDSSGLGILSTAVQPFAADNYPRIEWTLRGADPAGVQLSFLWRTLERPKHNFHVDLEWRDGSVAWAELGAQDGWSGTITGVGLVVRGGLSAPLVVQSFTAPSMSAGSAVLEIGRQWSMPFPFKGTTITLPFDAERSDYASPLIVVAAAQGLAIGAYYFLARRRQWPRDPRVLWAIVLIGWLLLDLRWQANLWRQLAQTARQFAGKTTEEKHLAAYDHELFELMRQVNGALPAPPVRIHFLSDNSVLRARGAFFLYPQNVYHDPRVLGRTPDPEQVHSGDYVLLFLYRGLDYERLQQRLLWPDGRSKAADEILALGDGIVLVRAR